jgi:hypothetical protein
LLRLEITGTTPDELYFNTVKMLSLLLKGGATPAPAEPADDAPSAPATPIPPVQVAELPATADGASNDPAPKRRGRPKVEKAESAKSAELNDPLPDLAAKTEVSVPKELTLDGDIRPRLREILTAHQERGHTMEVSIAYIQKLYGPFGIAKAEQLKPEQYAEFFEASESYLKGEA